MSTQATEILDAMLPPSALATRTDYRPYATRQMEARSFDELRCLCVFFRSDIGRLVTRVMDYQFKRTRGQVREAREAARKRRRQEKGARR